MRIAPPVTAKSMEFMANSIEIIDMSDILTAVLIAAFNGICLLRIKVSSRIDVIKPFKIAIAIIKSGFQNISKNWKKAIVPKSPMEHPKRHQRVLFEAVCQVCLQIQFIFRADIIS